MWVFLDQGSNLESPALAGRFITTREVSGSQAVLAESSLESPRCRGTSSLYPFGRGFLTACLEKGDRVRGCRHPHLELNLPKSLFEVWLWVLDSHLVSSSHFALLCLSQAPTAFASVS